MMDRSKQRPHHKTESTVNTRKRERTNDDNTLNLAESRNGREAGQYKRARIRDDVKGEWPMKMHDSRGSKLSVEKSPTVYQKKLAIDECMETADNQGNRTGYEENNPDVHGQDQEQKAGEITVNIEQLCASETTELFLLKKTSPGPSIMLMKVTNELANKMKNQVMTSRSYRRTKTVSIPELDRAIEVNKHKAECLLKRMQAEAKLKGDRKPTPQETYTVQHILEEARDLETKKKQMEAGRQRLIRDTEFDRRTWENAALSVENMFENVFVQCGLIDGIRVADDIFIAPQGDKSKSPEPSLVKGQPDAYPGDAGSLDNNQVRIKMEVTKARRELRIAQRNHDEHRDTFRRGLVGARIAALADRPDAPKRLIEEDFSRDYVRTGFKLAGEVTRAEVARDAVLAAAAEAGVSIIRSDDSMDPNIPYDLEEYAAVKMKNLDRDAVEDWNEAVEARFKPNLRPLGYLLHMADKWKKALEADDEISNAGEESISDAGVEHHEKTPAIQDSVLKPVLKGKSRNAQPLLCLSDYANGKKRRRIDDWMREIQQPVGR
jgi:hypothetical protein